VATTGTAADREATWRYWFPRFSRLFIEPYRPHASAAPAVASIAVFFRPALPVWLDHAPTASAVAASAVFLRPSEPAHEILVVVRIAATARAVTDVILRTITISSHPALSIGV
jgi:hypothetical protein